MFKKREKPAASRQRDEAGAGDGESGKVPAQAAPVAVTEGRATSSSSTAGEGGGRIRASTRRGDSEAAEKLESRAADTALSGIKASGKESHRPSSDAVRQLETETEFGKDVRAKHERNQEIHKGLKAGDLEAGVYRGLGGYKQYAERSEGAISASKYSGLLGPTRGMQNVRTTMRIEYWAASSGTDGGICKDYKETGYCGFGDSCKYLHDRSDYKSGHLIEREWEEKQKAIEERKRKRWERKMLQRAADKEGGAADAGDDDDESDKASSNDSDEEGLPAACPACDAKWEDCKSIPVQTVCGHFFCEDCAMESFARTPKCPACGAPTNGIFNSCEALEQKIRQQKAEKAAKKRKKTGMDGNRPYGIGIET